MNPMRMPFFAELPKSKLTKVRPRMSIFGLRDFSNDVRAYYTH